MNIISHRGYWQNPEQKNTQIAFTRSFDLGYGTETDVRDCARTLVISHDCPHGGELELSAVIAMAGAAQPLLALNVKADGLASDIACIMRGYGRSQWFVFDMSIPDTRQQLAQGNPVFMRMSEYERDPPFLDRAAGIWLDAFEDDAWRIGALRDLLARNMRVCLVSPELHRRPHLPFWSDMRDAGFAVHPGLTLCTDVPEEATDFFTGTQ